MMNCLGLGLGLWRFTSARASTPAIITYAPGATTVVAQPVTEADTPADAFTAAMFDVANYQSSAGTISSAVRQTSVNGGAWSTTLTADLVLNDVVAIRVLVTDSAANTRYFPGENGSSVLVDYAVPEAPAPSITPAQVEPGGTLTITPDGDIESVVHTSKLTTNTTDISGQLVDNLNGTFSWIDTLGEGDVEIVASATNGPYTTFSPPVQAKVNIFPVVEDVTMNEGNNSADVDVSEEGTVVLGLYTTEQTNPQVVLDGTGATAHFTYEFIGTNDTVLFDLSAVPNGTYWFCWVILDDENKLSEAVFREQRLVTNDTTAPTIQSSNPAHNATGVSVGSSIAITFNEPIQFGTGNIVLRTNNGGWSDDEVFDVQTEVGTGNGQVSISGAVLTINPTGNLANSREYAVRIAATAIDDLATNSFAGIADDTTLSFTTAAAAGSPPSFVAAATTYNSVGSGTLAWPTHQADDVAILFVLNRGNDGPITTPSGWTALTLADGGVNSTNAKLAVFWRRAAGSSEAAADISDGNGAAQRTLATMFVYRGCAASGTPLVELGEDAATGTALTADGGATGGDNRTVLAMFGVSGIDQATSALSGGFTNADLTGLVNRLEYHSDGNSGYGLYAAEGVRQTSGTIAATTGTLSASAAWASKSIALIPA